MGVSARRDVILFTLLVLEAAAIGFLWFTRDSGDDGLADRVSALEAELDETRQTTRNAERATERERRYGAELERRLVEVERQQAETARQILDGAGAQADDDAEPARAAEGSDGDRARREQAESATRAAAALAEQTEELGARLGEITIRLKTAKLRRLPEQDRWDKAREVVDLNDVQIAEIQSATVQRDGEFERCITHRTEIDPDGATRYIGEVDVEIRQAADEVYTERLDNTLTDEQRRIWHAEGYEGAFGVNRPRPYEKVDRRAPK